MCGENAEVDVTASALALTSLDDAMWPTGQNTPRIIT